MGAAGKLPRGSRGRGAPSPQLRESRCAGLPGCALPLQSGGSWSATGRGGRGAPLRRSSRRQPRVSRKGTGFEYFQTPSPLPRAEQGSEHWGSLRVLSESFFRLAPPSSRSKHFSRYPADSKGLLLPRRRELSCKMGLTTSNQLTDNQGTRTRRGRRPVPWRTETSVVDSGVVSCAP